MQYTNYVVKSRRQYVHKYTSFMYFEYDNDEQLYATETNYSIDKKINKYYSKRLKLITFIFYFNEFLRIKYEL